MTNPGPAPTLSPTVRSGRTSPDRNRRRLLPLLTLTALTLSACNGGSVDNDYVVLSRFDPDVTTVETEAARQDALTARTTLAPYEGLYCQSVLDTYLNKPLTGHTELKLIGRDKYLLMSRFSYNHLIRTHTELGYYRVRGHDLVLVANTGTERQIALTSITPTTLNVWGDLPLSTTACGAAPLTGSELRLAERNSANDLRNAYPWK